MTPIRPILRDANITEQQWRVLRVLSEQESMDAATIAETALLYAQSVSRIIRELTSRGLIVKTIDKNDNRRLLILITEEGQSLLDNTKEQTLKILGGYEARFGARRLALLREELQALTLAIGLPPLQDE